MITLDGGQSALINSGVRGATYLLDLEFLSGTQYYTVYPNSIVANGHTYGGLGNVLTISSLRESETISLDKLSLRVSIVDTGMLAYVIGDASQYRNRAVRIYLQLLSAEAQPVQLPMLRWSGFMDKVKIERRPSQTGPGSGSIDIECVRAGLARFRKGTGLRLSHAQQQLDYPGDLGLEYTEALVADPPIWLSKAFQKV